MKQRVASFVMALGLALGVVVVAEEPASAAAAMCRTNMHVIYAGSSKYVRVDNDGCFRVRGFVKIRTADNQPMTYASIYLSGTPSTTFALPAGSSIVSMWSEVIVTSYPPVMRTLTWQPLSTFQWRVVSV